MSVPRPSKGGGIAIIYKNTLSPFVSLSHSLPFSHLSFEFAQLTFSHPQNHITFACIYRPPPSTQNKLTNSMFFTDFDTLLDHYSSLTGKLVILGDFNFHYDQQDNPDTKRLCLSLRNHNLTQHVTQPTHQRGHTLDWLVTRDNDLIVNTDISTDLPSDHSAILATLNLPLPPKTKHPVTRRNIKRVDRSQFLDDAKNLLSNTCLLYTSPSPRDGATSRMPSSA